MTNGFQCSLSFSNEHDKTILCEHCFECSSTDERDKTELCDKGLANEHDKTELRDKSCGRLNFASVICLTLGAPIFAHFDHSGTGNVSPDPSRGRPGKRIALSTLADRHPGVRARFFFQGVRHGVICVAVCSSPFPFVREIYEAATLPAETPTQEQEIQGGTPAFFCSFGATLPYCWPKWSYRVMIVFLLLFVFMDVSA